MSGTGILRKKLIYFAGGLLCTIFLFCIANITYDYNQLTTQSILPAEHQPQIIQVKLHSTARDLIHTLSSFNQRINQRIALLVMRLFGYSI